MRRKILLPTDFSLNAENAIQYAIELYKNEECDFYILNVFHVMSFAADNMLVPEIGEIAYKSAKETSEEELLNTLNNYQKKNISRHKFFTISKFNSLLNSIDEAVEEYNIDLIVMGTQGATNAKGIIFGSNTVMVMEKERSCPVLAIPAEVNYSKPKEIVFPTSYENPYNKKEISYLIEIAKMNNAAIRILHVNGDEPINESQEDHKKQLIAYFEGLEYSFHTIKDVELQIALDVFVQSRDSDMIAFVNKKHGFLDTIFKSHLVQKLGYKSKVPVLTLHN